MSELLSDSKAEDEKELHRRGSAGRRTAAATPTSTALEAMREVLKEFFARLPKGR